MGLKPRLRVARLPEKLKEIREKLGLSQNELLKLLGYDDIFDRSTISHYETGDREPPLPVLLQYARIGKIYVELLIDDNLNLPGELPGNNKKS
ncbi:MAG: helix-turn-helix transcriptional regulator [Pyrinomonadaceae bacterium]